MELGERSTGALGSVGGMSAGIGWDMGSFTRMNLSVRAMESKLENGLVAAGTVVGIALIRDAVMIQPTVPKAPPPLGGTLREVGVTRLGAVKNASIQIDVVFDLPYAAPMHAGRWVTGPMAGVMVKNWSEPGSGPFWLSEKLRRFRQKYVDLATSTLRRAVGM